MIKPLFIATKENARILTKPLRGLEHEMPRIQTGCGWGLRRFIHSDLKNFMSQTHIILDVSAFTEQDDEFIELLLELRDKHEKAVIIIYCDCFTAGDLFLDKLVNVGFINIIANYSDIPETENQERITEDISECLTGGLSPQKYRRFILNNESDTETDEAADDSYRAIAVFGSQNRIGTTKFTLGLCKHAAESGSKAALVLCGDSAGKEQDLMRKHFDIRK